MRIFVKSGVKRVHADQHHRRTLPEKEALEDFGEFGVFVWDQRLPLVVLI